MKLKRFLARNVYGHINLDIKFDDGITILIGPNGSGKSTALKLMEAILTPSLKELASIDFDSAEVTFEDGSRAKKILAKKEKSHFSLQADWVDSTLVLDELGSETSRLLVEGGKSVDDYFDSLAIGMSSSPTFKAISEISAPVFLGIDRRQLISRYTPSSIGPDGEYLYEQGIRRNTQARRIIKGSLAAGLAETQALVQEAYRTARRQMDMYQARLRDEVLLSAFHYSDLKRDEKGEPTFEELGTQSEIDLELVKQDIEKTLSEIGLNKDVVRTKILPFFDKLSQLLGQVKKAKNSETDTMVEYLMNRGQLDRLRSLIGLVQDHKKLVDQINRKLNSFVETINWFYSDSKKKISLDAVGRIVIARRDGKHIPVDALSSGERQLLIMFTHLFFNAFGSRSKVFVIDEPEISLHLRWQENLIEKVQEASPGIQIVMATHSPDIVGEFEDKCVEVSIYA